MPGYAAEAALTASRLPPHEREERYFLRGTTVARRFEAEASQLALVRSSDPAVRTFATGLLQEQFDTAVSLQRLLQERGMALPMLDNPDRKVLNKLGKLSRSRFDREYLALVTHRLARDDVPAYERAAAQTQDPALKAWVDARLPGLHQRLVVAERLTQPPGLASQPPPVATGRGALVTSRMGSGPRPLD